MVQKKKKESISMHNNLTNVDIKFKFLFNYTLALLSIAILQTIVLMIYFKRFHCILLICRCRNLL